MKAQEGHEGEVKAQEEQGEDANSLHEESHVSNRHMTWWHDSWWVRVNNGPHLRTARDRRRVWRAATRAAQEVRESGKGAGRERDGRREEREATSCTSSSTFPLQALQQQHQQQQQLRCACSEPRDRGRREGDDQTVKSDYRFHEWRVLTGSDDNVEKDMLTFVEGGRDVQSLAAILKNLHHNEQGMMSAAMQQPMSCDDAVTVLQRICTTVADLNERFEDNVDAISNGDGCCDEWLAETAKLVCRTCSGWST